jgi:hypothetical protein
MSCRSVVEVSLIDVPSFWASRGSATKVERVASGLTGYAVGPAFEVSRASLTLVT